MFYYISRIGVEETWHDPCCIQSHNERRTTITFLKKLGTILINLAGIAAGIGPILTPLLGSGKSGVASTVVNDLTSIASLIVQIETAGAAAGLTGAQKLKAAIPLVGNIIKTSEVVIGKKIQNEAMFAQAIQEYTQATVDLLNAIHPDEAARG